MLHGLQGLLLHSAYRRTTIDARSLLHRRRASTTSHHVLRGRPSCPLRSEKRRGAEKTGATMLHGRDQDSPSRLVHAASLVSAPSRRMMGCIMAVSGTFKYKHLGYEPRISMLPIASKSICSDNIGIYISMQFKTDLILQIYLSCVVCIIDQVMVTAEGKDPTAKVPIYLHNSTCPSQVVSPKIPAARRAGARAGRSKCPRRRPWPPGAGARASGVSVWSSSACTHEVAGWSCRQAQSESVYKCGGPRLAESIGARRATCSCAAPARDGSHHGSGRYLSESNLWRQQKMQGPQGDHHAGPAGGPSASPTPGFGSDPYTWHPSRWPGPL
jgi:hypothetical protein